MSFKPLNRTAPSPVQLMDDAAEPAALHAIGVAQAELGRFAEARSNLGQALAARQALSQRDPRNAQYRADVASTRVAQGRLAWTSGRLAEAVGIWRDVRQLMSADIAANPNEPVLAQQLVQTEVVMGQSYAENALWGEAAEAIGLAVKHGLSDRTLSVTRLSLLAVLRERDTLLQLVPELLDRYGKTSEPLVASGLARWCSLVPGAVPDSEHIVVLAQEAPLFGHTGAARSFNLSLAEYRAGRFQGAIHHAHESLEFIKTDKAGPFEALNGSILTMAYHRLGQHDEAKRWLARIIEIDWQAVGHWPSPASWWDRSDFLTLKREAIELVTGKPAPDDPWLRELRAGAYAQLNEPAKADAERAAANTARSGPGGSRKTGSTP